jgi:hypothetical protein
MKKTLQVVNRMQEEGLFLRYAVGGGIAALFYIEPIATFDLDIFVILPETKDSLLIVSPLYDWIKNEGYQTIKEHVIIDKIPVQFIPAYSDLVKEAVLEAVEKQYDDVTINVISPEYLIAIMLDTNRPKDRERILMMLEEAEISEDRLLEVLKKHELLPSYTEFKKKYGND